MFILYIFKINTFNQKVFHCFNDFMCIMRFGYRISEFMQGEWIVVIFIVAGFKFELLVFCLATKRLEFITVVFR